MFIGHYAVALAAKKAAPKASLGILFIATLFIDLIWPKLLLLGIEHVEIEPGNTAFTPLNFISYPLSHSLAGVLIWSGLLGGAFYLIRRDTKSALWIGLVLLSHWFLDLLTHRPDLQLIPGLTIRVGFGLWNSIPATIITESALFIIGIFIYLKTTRAKNLTGHIAFWAMIALLSAIYAGNLLGPPPPSVKGLALVALSQ